MRFEYSPATPDDWPSAIAVTVAETEEGSGIEEGETRFYEPNWKHRVAGRTIREQREKMEALDAANAELESLVRDMGGYIDGIANRTHTVNVAYGNDLLDRMAELGIEVPDEVE